MTTFTTDGDGRLPGPLWAGQSPKYKKNDGSLGTFLAGYSGHPAATSSFQNYSLISCPSYIKSKNGNTDPMKATQFRAAGTDQYGDRYLGYPGGGGGTPYSQPMFVTQIEKPTEENFLFETDNFQKTSGSRSVTPHHGFKGGAPYRSRVYYDGHVKISTEAKQE